MRKRKKLSDILHNGDGESLAKVWANTEAAKEFVPLPSGEYLARVIDGEPVESRSNKTPGYKLRFQVIEGEYAGHYVWHDLWLTEAAMPMTKRELSKLGVTSHQQLEQPLPPGIRCRLRVALRKADDGVQYNRVRSFEVVGIDPPERDPFAPQDNPSPEPTGSASAAPSHQATGDKLFAEPPNERGPYQP